MARPAVLVVEPDEQTADQLKGMLDRLGYEAILTDAETALLIFNYVLPVAVLLAYPHGRRITENVPRYVLKESVARKTPVLGMFPIENRLLARHAFEEGCFDTIPKPIGLEALRTILTNAINPR